MRSPLLAVLLATSAGADTITTVPQDALDWTQTPEGVAFADQHGSRFSEAYMSMVRLPAGTVSPPHSKSATMFGVMISGTMTHVAVGSIADAAPLTESAFYMVPANLPHVSSCISADPCITFLYQDGAFDFVPATQ